MRSSRCCCCCCCCCCCLLQQLTKRNALRSATLLGGQLGRVVMDLGQRMRRQVGHWQTNDHWHSLPRGLLRQVRRVHQVTRCRCLYRVCFGMCVWQCHVMRVGRGVAAGGFHSAAVMDDGQVCLMLLWRWCGGGVEVVWRWWW